MLILLLAVLVRLGLAAMFAAAGLAKLGDVEGTNEMLAGFGVPARWVPSAAAVLAATEILAASALVLPLPWRLSGLAALIPLVVFTGAIAVNLMRGRRPNCNCFGQLQSAPIGIETLVRNVVLVGLASFVVLTSLERADVERDFGLTRVEFVLAHLAGAGWVMTIAVAILLVGALRQQSAMAKRLAERTSDGRALLQSAPGKGLPVGSLAPAFRLIDSTGAYTTLDDLLRPARPLLLLFTNANCLPCTAMAPEVAIWEREHSQRLRIVRIAHGRGSDNDHGVALLQVEREVSDLYQCWGTPGAILIRPDGTVGSRLAQGVQEIRALVATALQQRVSEALHTPLRTSARLAIGARVPDLTFADAHGSSLRLSDHLGRRVLLLFWSHECGYCRRMLPKLQAWDTSAPVGAPVLLLVPSTSDERNKSMGLRTLVLSDELSLAWSAFGVRGTPTGVLLDEEGRVAAPYAAGADAIIALLKSGVPQDQMVTLRA